MEKVLTNSAINDAKNGGAEFLSVHNNFLITDLSCCGFSI